jgi:hypothetical protein
MENIIRWLATDTGPELLTEPPDAEGVRWVIIGEGSADD